MKTTTLAAREGLGSSRDASGGLWNIDELARYLRLSRKAAYALVASMPVPRLRIGARLRFRPHEVEAWLAKQAAPRVQQKTNRWARSRKNEDAG